MTKKTAKPPRAFARLTVNADRPREVKSEYCRLNADIDAAANVTLLAAKCKGWLSFSHLFIPITDVASEYNA